MREAWEPDFSAFGAVLAAIGGWTVGCEYHVENAAAVDTAKSAGLVGTRIHKCPIDPEGWECFELTDAGIKRFRELCGEDAADGAAKRRQWYRDNAAHYSGAKV